MSQVQTLPQPEAMPRARLLFVTAETHPTFRADVRVLFGKYLPRLGIDSDLFAQSAGVEGAQPWPAGQTWLAPAGGGKWLKQWLMLRHDLTLWRRARQGYAAVQVRDRMLAGAMGLWAARRAGIKFIYWASYPKPEMRMVAARQSLARRQPLRWLAAGLRGALGGLVLYHWVLPRADHVFVQSEAMKLAFAARGVPVARMTAVPMGVDLEALATRVEPDDTWRARLAGRRLIVYAGALDKVRQPALMIEAMAQVRRVQPRALLLMVGGAPEGADLAELQAMVARLELGDHVLFTGWVSPAQTLGFVAAAEVGLSMIPRGPLYDVSSPTKLAEYLALGVPAVANDLPDQLQVLRDSGAGACVAFDAAATAAAVLQLLHDPARAQALGAAGQSYVEQHRSYAALASTVADVYGALLS